MKNLKKITRQEQKEILGGGVIGPILMCNTSADCAPGLCCRKSTGACFTPPRDLQCAGTSPIGG